MKPQVIVILSLILNWSPASFAQEAPSVPRPRPTLKMPYPIKTVKPVATKTDSTSWYLKKKGAYERALGFYTAYDLACEQGLRKAKRENSMKILQQTVKEPAARLLNHLLIHRKYLSFWSNQALKKSQRLTGEERLRYAGFALTLKYADLTQNRKFDAAKAMAGTIRYATTQDKSFYKRMTKTQIERMQSPLFILFNQDAKKTSRSTSSRSVKPVTTGVSAYQKALSLYKAFDLTSAKAFQEAPAKGGMKALQNEIRKPSQRFFAHLQTQPLEAWTQRALQDLKKQRGQQRLFYSGFVMTLKYADFKKRRQCRDVDCVPKITAYLLKHHKGFHSGLSKAQIERMSYTLLAAIAMDQ